MDNLLFEIIQFEQERRYYATDKRWLSALES